MKKRRKQAMTRKEALAILRKLYTAVGWHLYAEDATQDMKVIREQAPDAFRILETALHGEAPLGFSSSLCEVCYLRFVPIDSPWVFLKSRPDLRINCCDTCREHLKAEGQLDRCQNWETGEVALC